VIVDFSKEIYYKKGEDLLVSDSKWNFSERRGRLSSGSPLATFLKNSLSITSAIFTIWIFAETRETRADKKQVTSEQQFQDLNDHMEYLNIQMEGVQHSLMHLTCLLFDAVQAQTKNKPVSRECLQFIQKHKQAETYETYSPILAKPSHFITKNHIENNNSFSTSLWWAGSKN
jgi:hypothetical protein